MNRVLKRPMFRRGGSTGGITSGLRQGYANQSRVKQNDDWRSKQLGDVFTGKTTLGELQDISGAMQYKPRGTNVYDFMTEMGLDLVSRPAAGNIFQQVATSAKEPYQRFMERKETARGQEYASESDMFKTMLGSYGDILAAEAEGKAEGKGWLEQWKFEQIPILNKKIRDLTAKQGDGTITADEELELENSIDQKGRIQHLDRDQFGVSYRTVNFPFPLWFLSCVMSFSDKDKTTLEDLKELRDQRIKKQPLTEDTCGSVFKNPTDHFAGELIEQAGLKGFKIGSASISKKHANFIINEGGAKAEDIEKIIDHVRTVIKKKYDIDLHTEVRIIGEK